MILFIDDEVNRGIKCYIEELEFSDYEVITKQDVDSAFKFLQDNFDKIRLIILDIMMPPGQLFRNHDTNDGITTGMSFYQKIRKISEEIPIIIFTNYTGQEVKNKIGIDENSIYLYKSDYLPYELVEKIQDKLRTG